MDRKRTLTITVLTVTAALITLAGCDVSLMYPSWEEPEWNDGTGYVDENLLTVVAPGAEEVYNPGGRIVIEWAGWVDAEAVEIDLYRSGSFLMEIAPRVANPGSFTWNIPVDFNEISEVNDEYQVSVRAQHGDHSPGALYVQALSDPFTIVPASSGGLSDVTVDSREVVITMIDNGQEIDGDTIDVILNGETVLSNHALAAAPGTDVMLNLQPGANILEIYAVNEGSISPNTAQLLISNVINGETDQQWRLAAGESGSLVITAP